MIKWSRRAVIGSPGDIPRGIAFAKDMCAQAGKHGVDLKCYMARAGQVGELMWVAHYASMQEMDEKQAAIRSDAEYWAKIEAASDLFLSGSGEDEIFAEL